MHFDRLVFILVDGMSFPVFESLLASGLLLNIEKYLIARGTYRRIVSVFPSTTGPAYLPFLMGYYPGTAGIPGIRWLSKDDYHTNRFGRKAVRSYMGYEAVWFNRDLPHHRTLFHHFDRSSSIYNLITRGCHNNRTKWLKPFIYFYTHFSHHWELADTIGRSLLMRSIEENDDFVFAVLPGIDGLVHLSTPNADRVISAYRDVDRTIGRVFECLHKRRALEKTLVVLTSDHGLTYTHTHLDLIRFLGKIGWKCLHYPLIFKNGARSVEMVSGNGMVHLYFKNCSGWKGRMYWETLDSEGITEAISNLEGIDLIAGLKEDGTIVVRNRKGEGYISLRDQMVSYRYRENDPFGYNEFFDSFSLDETLERTYDTGYPDGLMQMIQIFRTSRTGDLVVSAKKGYDLRAHYEWPEHKSTHGALFHEQIMVPLAITTEIRAPYIRTVDLFPIVLRLMGKESPQTTDGRDLS